MNAPLLTEEFQLLAAAPNGVKKLRELILSLAVRGKLVPQNFKDEPAAELLKRIKAEKANLVAAGKLKNNDSLPTLTDDKAPFALPKGWEWSRLGIAALINPRNSADDGAEVSFVPMTMITTSFDGTHAQERRKWSEVKQGFTHFAEGDVGVAKITPCFENSKAAVFTGLANGVGAGTTELHIVRPVAKTLLPRYVLAYLKSPMFLSVGETKMTGTAGQKRLPKDFVEANPFPLPPLDEQHRIVAKVDELMALCDQLDAQQTTQTEAHERLVATLLDTLTQSADAAAFADNWSRIAEHFDLLFDTPESIDKLKQSVLQLAVQGKLIPQDSKDEAAIQLLSRVNKARELLPVQSEPPYEVPGGWEWASFCNVGSIATNLVAPEGHTEWQQVAPDCIEKGTGQLVIRRTVAQAGIKSGNHKFHAGQILYSKIRPTLSKAVIAETKGLCSADMYPIDSLIDTRYLLMFILSAPFLAQAAVAENRVKMPKLNQEELNKFHVAVPPLAEQHRIVAKVDELIAVCDALAARLSAARDLSAKLAATVAAAATA